MAGLLGAGIGASAVAGYLGATGAASSQAGAEGAAIAAQESMFNRQMEALQPYYKAGYNALDQIQANLPQYNKPFTMEDFYANKDPGYQFRLEQGENAIQRAAAASGSNVGASALASLGNYAQGSASQEYQAAFNRYQTQVSNSYNRLASLAGLGQAATQTGTAAGTAAGGNIMSAIQGIGNAQAAGQVGAANAFTGAIGQGIGAYQSSQLIDALKANRAGGAGGGGNYVGPDPTISNLITA